MEAKSQQVITQMSGDKGISQNSIKSILQDRNGYIWIGTYNGINKYDGYSMQYFNFSNQKNSLSSNSIHSLFEDRDGSIWAGTSDAGINKINPVTGEIKAFFNTKLTSEYFKNVRRLHQSETGVVFYKTKKGLRLFKVSDKNELVIDTLVSNFMKLSRVERPIIKGENGKHWLLTPGEENKLKLLTIHEEGGRLNISQQNTGLIENLFEQGYATSYLEYPKNTFWIVSNKLELLKVSLNDRYELLSKELIKLTSENSQLPTRNKPIIVTTVDKNGRLWIGGDNVLLSYNTSTGQLNNLSNNKKYQIEHKQIESVLVDRSNILWIGTYYNGLYKIDLENRTFLNSEDFFTQSSKATHNFHKYPVAAITENKNGDILLGGLGNGGITLLKQGQIEQSTKYPLNYSWDLKYFNNTSKNKNSLLSNIRRIFIDSDDVVWVGSDQGLGQFEMKNDTQFSLNPISELEKSISNNKAVFAIEEDANKGIWVGYWGQGLVYIEKDGKKGVKKITHYKHKNGDEFSLSNNYVRDIFEDTNHNLWVGTVGGLNRVKRSSSGALIFERFLKEEGGLSNNHILDVFQASNGKIYVGTFGGGLNEIELLSNGKVKIKQYTIQQGLPSDVVYQISEDNQGNIWLMHVRELSKFNTATGQVSYFDRQDGFGVSEFKDSALLKTKSGTFLCGGVNGFTFFNPENFSVNTYLPQITITGFKLFDKAIKPGLEIDGDVILTKDINESKEINLSYDLNSIEFTFSSLHYSNPEKNNYKYKLEGFEEHWQYSKGNERRFATYTNLPPGKYTFKVFGSNSSGIWSKKPKEITVVIRSPWYTTPVAIVLFIVIFTVILYGIAKVRLHQINLKSELELESALHEKSMEMNQIKLQFFTNISHELRTPLTLIMGPLQQIMKGDISKGEVDKLNSIMYKNSNRLLKLINQLLDFRKAESGNLELIVQEGELVRFSQGVFHAFEEVASKKKIKFLFLPEEEEISAWFDSDKVEKILYNLLSNAFKYTPSGNSITLKIKSEEIDGVATAIIDVIDYGIGIPEEDLASIFERFYQAKKGKSTLSDGSGLGLAYVKHLVEVHKGSIKVNSKINEGTKCRVYIPIRREVYSEGTIAATKPNVHHYKYSKLGVETIKERIIPANTEKASTVLHSDETPLLLIVEDNVELREYLKGFFGNFYRVIVAEHGQEGLEMTDKYMPDVIISDLMMPVMGGIEMCRKIKTNINTSHISVIILTAKVGLENEKEGLETGADEFVLKPFDIEILKLRVENTLKTKQVWAKNFQTEKSTKSWKELTNKLDQKFLEKAISIVNENLDNLEFSVEKFNLEIGMSRSTLFKKMKSVTGYSPSEFIRDIRIKKAASLLETAEYSITEVILLVGFSDPKYFRTCFKKQYNMTPSEYIKTLKQQK
ncbi:two-component regulator propeller domain-containing protein [Wenyingzhuangia sp. IMCC45574]